METLRNEFIEIVEKTKNFRTITKINHLQFSNGSVFYKTITKKRVEKLNLGKLLGLRVYDIISEQSYNNGQITTITAWVFENGESQ